MQTSLSVGFEPTFRSFRANVTFSSVFAFYGDRAEKERKQLLRFMKFEAKNPCSGWIFLDIFILSNIGRLGFKSMLGESVFLT